jgi:hypothetical protein
MLSRSSKRAILLSEEMSGPEDFALLGVNSVSCNGSDPTVRTQSDPIGGRKASFARIGHSMDPNRAAAMVLNRPRVCKKSGVMLPVGKILTKAPLLEAPSHSSSRFTAKRNGNLKSFPTASLRTDFSHSLGHFWTFAPVNRTPKSRHSTMIGGNIP